MINLLLKTSSTDVYTISNNNAPVVCSKISTVHPYSSNDNFFNFEIGDLVIVISAGSAMDLRNIPTIASATKMLTSASSVSVERVFIFTEDLYTFKNDTAEELIFLRQLVDYMRYSWYRIYHCEQNSYQLNTLGLDVKYFDWFVSSCVEYYTTVLDRIKVSDNFKNTICCLNRRFGEHRYLASAVLSNYTDVYYSQQYSLKDTSMHYLDIGNLKEPVKNLVVMGLTHLQNRTVLTDRSMPVEIIDPFEYSSSKAVHDLNYKTRNAYCSLITESRFHSDFPNFSEKTLRALYSGRPFLLLAPAGTLKLLQQLGIKTFSDFWDESYDDIQDHTERFQRVMEITIEILSKKDLSIDPIKSILEHNQRQIKSIPRRMYELQFV